MDGVEEEVVLPGLVVLHAHEGGEGAPGHDLVDHVDEAGVGEDVDDFHDLGVVDLAGYFDLGSKRDDVGFVLELAFGDDFGCLKLLSCFGKYFEH